MTSFKKGIYLAITGVFVAFGISTIAYPQGALTLVQIVMGGSAVSSSNPLPVSGGGSNYGNQANFVSGTGAATGTGATTIIVAPSSNKLYITGVQCGRDDAGTTAIHVTLNDAASTILILPNTGGGGGNNAVFSTPIVIATTTAFTFTSSNSTTTVRCSAQGFNAA